MTQAQLSAIVGMALSLAFTLIPGIKTWFEERTPTEKQQVMGILILTTGFVISGLSCANVLTEVPCTRQGVMDFIFGVVINTVLALSANQATYLITREVPKVKDEAVG